MNLLPSKSLKLNSMSLNINIMSTKCYIHKNHNLLFRVVEKWCCKTNTFVFPLGVATITFEDIMVLGVIHLSYTWWSCFHHSWRPRNERGGKEIDTCKTRTLDIFFNTESEIQHETFLVTWLSIFVFSCYLVKNSLFHNDVICYMLESFLANWIWLYWTISTT